MLLFVLNWVISCLERHQLSFTRYLKVCFLYSLVIKKDKRIKTKISATISIQMNVIADWKKKEIVFCY